MSGDRKKDELIKEAKQLRKRLGEIERELGVEERSFHGPDYDPDYRDILHSLPHAVAVFKEGKVVFVNRATIELMGYKGPEDVIGKDSMAPVSEKERERIAEFVKRRKAGDPDVPAHYFTRMIRVDGREVPVEIFVSTPPEGHEGETWLSMLDVSESLRTRQEITESEERFRTLAERSPNMIFINRDGKIIYVNEKCVEAMEYSRGDFYSEGFNFLDIIGDEYKTIVARDFLAQMNGEEVPPREMKIVTKSGKKIDTVVSTKLFMHGDRMSILGIVTDVSRLKEIERGIRESEERYRSLFEDSPIALWEEDFSAVKDYLDRAIEEQGDNMESYLSEHPEEIVKCSEMVEVIDVNRASLDLFKADSKKELKENLMKVFGVESFSAFRDGLAGVARGKSGHEAETIMYALDGEERHVFLKWSAAPGCEEDLSKVYVSILDMTAMKKVEKDLMTISRAVDSTGDAVVITDGKGGSFYHNQAFIDLFGYTPEELNQAGGPPAVYKDKELARSIFDTIRKGASFSGEVTIMAKDGKEVPVFLRADAIKDEYGETTALVAIGTDISDVKKAEEALRESEERYRLLFNVGQDMIFVNEIDLESGPKGFIEVNEVAYEKFGYSKEEFLEKEVAHIVTPSFLERIPRILEEFKKEGQIVFEAEFLTPDGKEFPAEVNAMLFELQARPAVLSIARDITERKHAEQEIRKESAFRNAIIENAAEGLAVCHEVPEFPYVCFTVWNDRMTEITGYTMKEINELGWYQSMYSDPVISEAAAERMGRMRYGENLVAEEWTVTRKDKKRRTLSISTSLLDMNDETGPHVLALMQDVTDRRIAEEALAEEKERLAVTLRSIGDGVITTDTEGRVVLINKAAEELTGWTQVDAFGTHISEVFSIEDEDSGEKRPDPVQRVLEKGGAIEIEDRTVLVAKDGSRKVIADSGSPIRDRESRVIGVVLVFRDVTEKRRIEEELSKAEKLESLGILAGGIAHDFNNILTGILGNISMSKMYKETPDMVEKRLNEAERACVRARDLTQQLLTFSRGGQPVKEAASLELLVKESAEFALRGANTKCDYRVEEDLWPVLVDPGQMSQVVQNLVINADHAMPSGGTITVEMRNRMVEEGETSAAGRVEAGPYAELVVSDQGMGIPEDSLQKIFDPFFSTKQKGSGLGLSVTYSIIMNHLGHISVDSEMGAGTTFRILLPASPTEEPRPAPKDDMPVKGQGRILVMEDEEAIIELLKITLPEIGYEVDFARDGEEALEKYRAIKEKGGTYDAVIMDLTIPGGMGGKEAVGHLLDMDPDAVAIVSSGYSTDPVMSNYRSYGFKAMIAKPYSPEKLSRILKEALEEK